MGFLFVIIGYAVFQATLIHVYNCTSSNPDVARTACRYAKICVEECIEPMAKEMSTIPQHTLHLIKTLMDLSGAAAKNQGENSTPATNIPTQSSKNYNSSSESSSNTPTTTSTYNNVYHQQQQQQPINNNVQQQPSPMSVHAILSNWGKDDNNQQQQQQQPQPQQQDTFVPNNISAAAWQSLFSSAATPFFDNESDWQSK
jgi:hypothetical protein